MGPQVKKGCIVMARRTHEIIGEFYPQYHDIQSYPQDKVAVIRKAEEEWGILGNMPKCAITVDGVEFPSSEHIFQIMKFSDTAARKELLADKSGFAMKKFTMKRLLKAGAKCREDWEEHLLDIMKFALVKKYEQSEFFRTELQRTAELGLFIAEDETSRQKGKPADCWGVVLQDGAYVGSNVLGRLLMELRDAGGKLEYRLPEEMTSFTDLK